MSYLLRCSPCWKFSESLSKFDNVVQSLVQEISNCLFSSNSLLQSTLPIKMGGLGIRDSGTLSISAFLGSVYDVSELLKTILPHYVSVSIDLDLNNCFQKWLFLCKLQNQLPEGFKKSQKYFDYQIMEERKNFLISLVKTDEDKARLLALQAAESNAWLNALPSATLGNLLDNNTFRISTALRLGLPVSGEHTCVCGETADIKGSHGLSCKKSAGRASRHRQINDILKRALISADCPALLEPSGVCRNDGKRADGMTLIPWKNGKQLLWDATCTHTLAKSYLGKTSKLSGAASALSEDKKRKKYHELLDRFIFVPFSVETYGPWGDEAKSLVSDIASKISSDRSHGFITQSISLAIQRGNAASVMGTIQEEKGIEEIFYV